MAKLKKGDVVRMNQKSRAAAYNLGTPEYEHPLVISSKLYDDDRIPVNTLDGAPVMYVYSYEVELDAFLTAARKAALSEKRTKGRRRSTVHGGSA